MSDLEYLAFAAAPLIVAAVGATAVWLHTRATPAKPEPGGSEQVSDAPALQVFYVVKPRLLAGAIRAERLQRSGAGRPAARRRHVGAL